MRSERSGETSLSDSEAYLQSCLEYEQEYENPPQVSLELITTGLETGEKLGPRDVAVSSAYQCYNSGVSRMTKRTGGKADRVADSTLEAGHHTTRMHFNITWHLKGVSRSTVHEIFNAGRFYNAEQQSQRYTEARRGAYLIPAGLSGEQKELYLEAADFANNAYFELIDLVKPEVERRVREMYPASGWEVKRTADRLNLKIDKVSLEVARYALPIAQQTTMYYTLNEISLLRLYRASQQYNFSDEARYVIARMVDGVRKYDEDFVKELPDVLPHRPQSFTYSEVTSAQQEFDELIPGGYQSALVSISNNLRETLALSARNSLKLTRASLPDNEALNILLDPLKNPVLSDPFDTGSLDPLTQALYQASVTFATKLSHTADSQRQRHRMTPAATASIEASYSGVPDYIVPMIIREDPKLKERFDEIMQTMYGNIERLIDAGVPVSKALNLLPNAHAIRVVESGNLFDWTHRWKQRLCILAQEEIGFITVEQSEALLQELPEAENLLLAPCALAWRAGTGKCPEGDRWCGQPVWKWKLEEYKKGRLV